MRTRTYLKLKLAAVLVLLCGVGILSTLESAELNQWLAYGFFMLCAVESGRILARIQKKIRATPRHHLVAGDPFTDWSAN